MDGWTDGQCETIIYTPPLTGERGYDNIQIVLPLTSSPVLMAHNDAHYIEQCIHDKLKLANLIVISSLFITWSVFVELSPINKNSIHPLVGMRYGVPFMSARHVIDAFYMYVVAVVYVASCCSHGPCFNETTRCRSIKYSSLIRYPSLFNTSVFRGS